MSLRPVGNTRRPCQNKPREMRRRGKEGEEKQSDEGGKEKDKEGGKGKEGRREESSLGRFVKKGVCSL